MKVISLWQPWASLIVMGYKEYETRSWSTKHRGPLIIHASKYKKLDPEIYYHISKAVGIPSNEYKGSWLHRLETGEDEHLFGAILGRVDLTGIISTSSKADMENLYRKNPNEILMGDYNPNRFAWKLENPKMIKPIPCRGKQGLWSINAPREIISEEIIPCDKRRN